MSKLAQLVEQVNQSGKYDSELIIWREGCYYTGRTKTSLRWCKSVESSHVIIKTASHANSLLKTVKELLQINS